MDKAAERRGRRAAAARARRSDPAVRAREAEASRDSARRRREDPSVRALTLLTSFIEVSFDKQVGRLEAANYPPQLLIRSCEQIIDGGWRKKRVWRDGAAVVAALSNAMQNILSARQGALLRLRYAEPVVRLRHAASAHDAAMPFSQIPKIPSLPLIGSSWIYFPLIGRYDIRDGSRSAWDIYLRYGPIVAQQMPGRRVVVRLFSANDIRTLYLEEGKTPRHVGSLPLKLFHESRKPQVFANDGLLHA
ncbi:hypothetical protein HPB50_014638 [Hyalomma asiaticum]|uniref:Uncharacterized protein n=1 Tax=Hyalomma asiaticum TaxID=266040 RepID=A0ACB7RSA5_HYAAI|nr:hypothetical protein HPB50_014638 [Hyalomma asiaticum]